MTKNKILLTAALAFGSLSIAMADVGPSKPSFYGKIEGGVAPYTEVQLHIQSLMIKTLI